MDKIKNAYNNWQEHQNAINELIEGGGGGGTNAVWGRIQGNLQAQTDLVAVLGTKANANNVYTKTQADNLLSAKADANDVYTKTQADALLDAKQNVLTAGAGITITSDIIAVNIINDTIASRTTVWSSQEVKDRFDAISGSARIVVVATLPASPEENTLYYVGTGSPYSIKLQSAGVLYDMGTTEIDLTGYYTKLETDALLNTKANANNVYTKTESDTKYQEKITDSLITTATDSDYISDVDATAKTNKRITLANIFNWLLGKLTTAITNLSTDNQIPSAKAVYDFNGTKYSSTFKTQTITNYNFQLDTTTRTIASYTNIPNGYYIATGTVYISNCGTKYKRYGIYTTEKNIVDGECTNANVPYPALTITKLIYVDTGNIYFRVNCEEVQGSKQINGTLTIIKIAEV